MLVVTRDEARERRKSVVIKSVEYHLTRYIGPVAYDEDTEAEGTDSGILPVAFLVEQPAQAVTPAHYHEANQFQLVTAGGGKLGKHEIGPSSVHYANAYTPYGPIVADERGVDYFTLRDGFDPGARHMPEHAAELRKIKRVPRQMMGKAIGSDECMTLFETADGIAAWIYRLDPKQTTQGTRPDVGGGQWWIPLRGSLMLANRPALPPLSCLFLSHAEPALSFAAGPDGLQIVCLQFARPQVAG